MPIHDRQIESLQLAAEARRVWWDPDKYSPSATRPAGEWKQDCEPNPDQKSQEKFREAAGKFACQFKDQVEAKTTAAEKNLLREIWYSKHPDYQPLAKIGTEMLPPPEIEIELQEVEKSIAALTSTRVEIFKHHKTGEPYYSRDFRNHPEFEKHLAVLERAWGGLPAEHPRRRTLEVIRILKTQQEVTAAAAEKYPEYYEQLVEMNHALYRLYNLDKAIQSDSKPIPKEDGLVEDWSVLEDERKAALKKNIATRDELLKKKAELQKKLVSSPHDFDLPREIFWRRVDGADIFMVGFDHTDIYYAHHRATNQALAKQAGILVVEGYADKPIGESLAELWKNVGRENQNHYALLIHDAIKANPSLLLAEIDPRDNSKVSLDHDKNLKDLVDLNPELLTALFGVLRKMSPHLALDLLADPAGLHAVLRMMSTSEAGQFSRSISAIGDYIQYNPMEFVERDGTPRMQPTGLELGEKSWADAVSALKLHLLARWQREGKLPPGPILDYEGARHIHGKREYFDDPMRAAEVVLQNAHLSGQAEALVGFAHNQENQNRRQQSIAEYLRTRNPLNALNPKHLEGVKQDHMETGFAKLNDKGELTTWRTDWSGREWRD